MMISRLSKVIGEKYEQFKRIVFKSWIAYCQTTSDKFTTGRLVKWKLKIRLEQMELINGYFTKPLLKEYTDIVSALAKYKTNYLINSFAFKKIINRRRYA